MSFGAFMEGLQGGVKSGQSIRRERQLDDIYDAARRKIKNQERADNKGRESIGELPGDDTSLGDPIAESLWGGIKDWFSNAFGGDGEEQKATAIPDPGAAELDRKTDEIETIRTGIPQTPENYPGEGLAPYASGSPGGVKKEDEEDPLKMYAPGARAAVSGAGEVVGQSVAAGPRATRSALGGLADVVSLGTKDPVGGPIEWAFDAPRAAIATGLRKTGDAIAGWTDPQQPQEAIPTSAPTGKRRPTAGLPPGGRDRRTSEQRAAAIPAAPAAPAAPSPKVQMTPELVSKIPWDKVDPISLPKFKTQDWVKYRDTAVRQLVIAGGVTVADAMDKVDQQVIGMQQRGTKALLQEGLMRLQAGDLKGAGNALVQMFQYVPSGTDAVVGQYNGQLVVQFVDEETGKPVGDPEPVNPDMLQQLWTQYANPSAWADQMLDRDKFKEEQKRTGLMEDELDLRERLLEEVQIPSAQSEADYRAALSETSVIKALGADQGLKPSERLANDEAVRKVIETEMLKLGEDHPLYEKLQNPDIQRELIVAIINETRRTGQPPEAVLIDILSRAKE